MTETLITLWSGLPLFLQLGLKIGAIILPLLGMVAYYTLAERKVIAYMHVRVGPNRVGPKGLLQPIADAVKLMFKEMIIPTNADRYLFLIAPVLALAPALGAWAVVPFTDTLVLADIDASLLYVLALTSMGVYGVVIAGWASNSKYAFLGAMRSAAQIVALRRRTPRSGGPCFWVRSFVWVIGSREGQSSEIRRAREETSSIYVMRRSRCSRRDIAPRPSSRPSYL